MNDKPIVTPGTPGAARVEYYACRADVEDLLARGHSARMAYERMKEQGRVTCSYSAFCDYVRGGGKRQHSRGGRKPPARVNPPTRPTPDTPRDTSEGPGRFEWPSKVDPKTLF